MYAHDMGVKLNHDAFLICTLFEQCSKSSSPSDSKPPSQKSSHSQKFRMRQLGSSAP